MLTSTISKAVFYGNGAATDFPFAFKVWDVRQLAVLVTDAHNVDSPVMEFFASLNAGEAGGGSVRYVHEGKPLPAGYKLTILRNMPFVQNTDLISGTRFDPQVIENQLDQATAERQQLKEELARAVKVPPSSDTQPSDLINEVWAAHEGAKASAASAALSANEATASAEASAHSAEKSASSAAESKASAHAALAAQVSIDATVDSAVELVQAAGEAQTARVEAEGDTQVARVKILVSPSPKAGAVPEAGGDGMLSPLWGVLPVGSFCLMPFSKNELPVGWYARDGFRYLLSSPQGQALHGLSAAFKTAWRITVEGSGEAATINVPTAFDVSGRGFFERSVDGVQVGAIRQDKGRNIAGGFGGYGNRIGFNHAWDAFFMVGGWTEAAAASYGGAGTQSSVAFEAARSWGAEHTGDEFSPLYAGMTAAIFLGV